MYIEKEKWEELKKSFERLYEDYDKFDNNTKSILNVMDFCLNDIDKNKSDKVYVITNNAVVDYEIFYGNLGITTNLEEAKEMLKQNIKNIKCDADFDNLNAIKITDDIDTSNLNEIWVYEENDYGFNLYLNGNYSSNNFSSQIEQYDLEKIKDKDKECDL